MLRNATISLSDNSIAAMSHTPFPTPVEDAIEDEAEDHYNPEDDLTPYIMLPGSSFSRRPFPGTPKSR